MLGIISLSVVVVVSIVVIIIIVVIVKRRKKEGSEGIGKENLEKAGSYGSVLSHASSTRCVTVKRMNYLPIYQVHHVCRR